MGTLWDVAWRFVWLRAMIFPLSCVCQDPSSFCFSIIFLKDSLYASICADVGSLYLILVGILNLFLVASFTFTVAISNAWSELIMVWCTFFSRTFFGSEGSGTPWLLWAVFMLARLQVCLGAFRGNFASCSGHKSKPRDPLRVQGGTPLGRTELVPRHRWVGFFWGRHTLSTPALGVLLDVQMWFCVAGARDCAPYQKCVKNVSVF